MHSSRFLVPSCLLILLFLAPGAISLNLPSQRLPDSKNPVVAQLSQRNDGDRNMFEMEKRVRASAQADLDMKRIAKALDKENFSSDADDDLFPENVPTSSSSVAIAGACAASAVSLLAFHSVAVSVFVLATVFIAANGDPNNEESIIGPMARVVGRATIKSVEASQPKVRALARAAVTGDEEIVSLKGQILELQRENEQLRIWQERRIKLDDNISVFTYEELKEYARLNGLAVGGTKPQLLLRLMDAGVIKI